MESTRRQFLKNSLAAAAGTGLASLMPQARARASANDRLTVGLIGCRNMGFANLKGFLKFPDTACAALCDVDAGVLSERAAEVEKMTGKKPKIYADFRDLIENRDIDAVIVGTPDHWHCLPLVMACQAGKDVYVEKPLANSIAECGVMLRAARRYDRIVQVGQQQRSGAHWQEAIRFVQSGKLGSIRRVRFWANFNYGAGQPAVPDEPVPAGVDFDMWLGPAPARTFNKNRFHGLWRLFWDYGGCLMTDWGVHLIDMGLWAMKISGPPKSTVSTGGIYASSGNALETADTQNVLWESGDFAMEWEHNAGVQTGPYGRNYGVLFLGTNGTLVADRDSWEVIAEGWEPERRMEPVQPVKSDNLDHDNHVRNFIDCVKTRQRPACDIETGRLAALYAHLGNIAYRTGRKVVWSDSKNGFINDAEADILAVPLYRKPWELPKI